MAQLKYFFFNGQQYFTESNPTIFAIINYFNYNTSLLVFRAGFTTILVCPRRTGEILIKKQKMFANLFIK